MVDRGSLDDRESLVCPLDYRYGRDEMKQVFSEVSRIGHLLKVEAGLARAHAKLGTISEAASEIIGTKATHNS